MKEKDIEWLETYSNCEDLFHEIRHRHKVQIKQMISDRQFDLAILNMLLDVGQTEIERLWSLQSPGFELEQSRSFVAAIAEIIEEKRANIKPQKEATHRLQAIAHEYKVALGIEKKLTAKEMRDNFGQKRYEAYLSLYTPNNKTKGYRPPTAEDLNEVIGLLSAYPQAQEKVKEDLKKLRQSQK